MRLGVRTRILLWLGAVVLPIGAISIVSASVVQGRLTDRVETELTNVLRLEAARIDRELAAMAHHVEGLAERAGVRVVVEEVQRDPNPTPPLDELAGDLVIEASDGTHQAAAVALLDPSGRILGASAAVDEVPATMSQGGTSFGTAYRSGPGDDRLPVSTTITGADGSVVGVLLIDYDLASITDLLTTHEGFGETSEAHIAQPTGRGDAAFITPLRFERNAAFTKVVPGNLDVPIVRALDAPEPTVVHALDYRLQPSILAYRTIEPVGWGLVAKIDEAEALGVIQSIRLIVVAGLLLMLISVAAGSLLVLRPLLDRIRRAAAVAEKMAAGHYEEPIGDEGTDEIAEMARSIDRLAKDLSEDIARRAHAEAQLLHQATHDQLTGVSNRLYAERVLRSQIEAGAAGGTSALLFLDLDGFKEVNDTWGHVIGDEILVQVAARLTRAVPATAMVARWGGDEFVVLLPGHDEQEASAATEAVRAAFEHPFTTSVGEHPLGASIGAATTDSASSADELLHLADGRMFSEKQHHRHARLLSTETALLVESALAENRVEAWFQPIACLEPDGTGRYIGAEALARLRTADGAVIEPSEFLPELQHTRFARLLDLRVAELTMAELANWRRAGIVDDDFLFTINLSPASLMHANLTTDLQNLVQRYEVPPTQLVLELSEHLVEPNQAMMASLRNEGFVIALDDFGLKHSNLDRLFSTGASLAKVDRRWSADNDVLAGLVRTCTAKGVELIVQGVETAEQAGAILAHGISCVQGYHFGRPQTAGMLAVTLNDLRHGAPTEA